MSKMSSHERIARTLRQTRQNQCQASLSEVSEILTLELDHFAKIFVIVDALDEASDIQRGLCSNIW
jgi:hypothetical protein